MPVRVQSIRSSTKGARPGAGTREPGEIYVNFADLQLGVVNAAKNPQDLVAIRYFSTAADYPAGSYVVNAGVLYKSKGPISAGAFNGANWDAIPLPGGYEPPIALGTTGDYWRGDKTWQVLNKAAVGLSNVDNTSDAAKPVSTLQQAALDAKVVRTGDAMSGHLELPTGPSAQHAVRKDYVDGLTGTINTNLALKADIASPMFTGDPKAPTPTAGDNDTSVATTAFVTSAVTTATSGKINEAPNDGVQYVRQSLNWSPVDVPPGTAVSDTPPPTPDPGQLWFESDTGRLFIWYVDVNSQQWVQLNGPPVGGGTAETRNRIVNGAMQVSQENARNTNLTASGAYPADQWSEGHAGEGTAGYANVPNSYIGADAGPYCLTLQTGTADAAMAATQFLQFYQAIEGTRLSDFNWGTADARQAVLRFKATSSIATTFAVSLRNAAVNRSFVKNCTIAANTPTWFTLVIPGDVTGTWAIDTSISIYLTICLAAGPTHSGGTDGAWVGGDCRATPATGNFWATAGARFSFGAVGLYLDPNNTGVPPAWQMPDEAEELRACQRYYEYCSLVYFDGALNATSGVKGRSVEFKIVKRIAPAMTKNDNAAVTTADSAGLYSFRMFTTNATTNITSSYIANARM